MNAAVQLEAQLASLLDQEPALRSSVVAQFEADGFPIITVITNDVNDLQSAISTNGLPPALLDGLTALGVDSQTITNWQNLLLTCNYSGPNDQREGEIGGLKISSFCTGQPAGGWIGCERARCRMHCSPRNHRRPDRGDAGVAGGESAWESPRLVWGWRYEMAVVWRWGPDQTHDGRSSVAQAA